jgi:hypothetical protein
LKNICINIPLLQEIKNILIYTKLVRDLCIKNSGRLKKEPPTIQVIGKLASLMSTEVSAEKYMDLGNLVVTILINKIPIANNLIDLGATINVITLEKMIQLGLHNLLPTPIVFELVDRSKLKIKGVLEDVNVLLDSWEYPTYLYVIQPKSNMGGNPLILCNLQGRTYTN